MFLFSQGQLRLNPFLQLQVRALSISSDHIGSVDGAGFNDPSLSSHPKLSNGVGQVSVIRQVYFLV